MPRPSEKDIQDAISAYHAGHYPSIRATANAFSLPPSTLKDRLKGRATKQISHQPQQRLTPAQEKLLVQFCKSVFWVPSHNTIRTWAKLFLKVNGDEERPLGRNWVSGFVKRNPEVEEFLRPGERLSEKGFEVVSKKGNELMYPGAEM